MRRAMICVLMVVGLLAVNSVAQGGLITVKGNGATVFSAPGFETDTVNAAPSATGLGIWNISSPYSSIFVTNANSPGPAEGSNYLEMDGYNGATNRIAATFGGVTAGHVVTDYSLYVADPGATERAKGGEPFRFAYTTDPTNFASWYPYAQLCWGVAFKEGTTGQSYLPSVAGIGANQAALYVLDGVGSSGYENVKVGGNNMGITLNAWHNVEVDWLKGAGTFTLSIDGVTSDPVLAAPTSGWSNSGATTAAVMEYTGDANPGDFTTYIDGVKPTPEPSTLALLAIGMIGLLAYAWRKRR